MKRNCRNRWLNNFPCARQHARSDWGSPTEWCPCGGWKHPRHHILPRCFGLFLDLSRWDSGYYGLTERGNSGSFLDFFYRKWALTRITCAFSGMVGGSSHSWARPCCHRATALSTGLCEELQLCPFTHHLKLLVLPLTEFLKTDCLSIDAYSVR